MGRCVSVRIDDNNQTEKKPHLSYRQVEHLNTRSNLKDSAKYWPKRWPEGGNSHLTELLIRFEGVCFEMIKMKVNWVITFCFFDHWLIECTDWRLHIYYWLFRWWWWRHWEGLRLNWEDWGRGRSVLYWELVCLVISCMLKRSCCVWQSVQSITKYILHLTTMSLTKSLQKRKKAIEEQWVHVATERKTK